MLHFASQQQIPAINNNSHSNYNSQDHHDSYHHQSSHHHNNAINGVVGDDVDHQRMSSSMGHNLSRNNGQQNHRIPDIARKPIKYVSLKHFFLSRLEDFSENLFTTLKLFELNF